MLSLRLVLGACLVSICAAHVRLTFPQARTFALDFLDNVRTSGPCGMEPSADGPVTVFAPGDVINVTWHLAYSHRGGNRLEIINRNDDVVLANLTGPTYFVNENDTTVWSQEVTIPSDMEGAYTLRLIRQAAEWVTGNPDVPYLFRSCADINITAAATCDGGRCSGFGTCMNGVCDCDALHSGEFCQYEDECINEQNCGGASNGECVDLGITTYPRRQCFCKPGFFGKDCMNMNPSGFENADTYDLSKHFKREINPRFTLYYKVIQENSEIEIAVDAMSTTWVGFGWRPLNLDGNCQNWPVHYTNGSAVSEPESESEAEATPTPAVARRRRRSSDEVRVRVARDNHDDDEGQDWECIVGSGPRPEGEPEPEGTSEPAAEGTPEPAAEGTPEPAAEGTAEPAAEPTPEPEGEPEPGSNLHPMDCMDFTIGMVSHGNVTRIHDYYTRDRSTPRLDSFYGGMDSLVAAMGFQWADGRTRIVFRKKLEATEQTDHSIANNDDMMAIWSRGQEFGRYVHNPPSGLEVCQASDYMFYRRDELKYHGTSPDQRGVIPNLNFYADPSAISDRCVTEETVEGTNCNGPRCDMRVTIDYITDTDSYDVTINTPIAMDQWTGIGFSSNGAMVGSDAILVWINGDDGMIQVKDYQLNGKSVAGVEEDANSDGLTVLDMNYQGGILNVKFNRLRNTGDSNDFVFTDEDSGCARLLLPKPGEGFGSVMDGVVQYHGRTPMVTGNTCIRPCTSPSTPSVGDGGGSATSIKPLQPLTFALVTLASILFSLRR
ncbi:uncharacterized protein LOC578616 isoform X1 [Strongylocentrotus purpuratus]|uniref:Uncharacterized protein n=1 Tax=Strongylocentrotus purpuratus TaxID=7668 RepID=A0A7M7PJ34_STRPU|nr:uncharacterized protein LOC578616 isoform X1 [Strongylocentrotus purpuratus]